SAIAELKVVSAEKTEDNEPCRPGKIVSYVENLTDPKKNGGGRFKTFVMALLGADDHEITVEQLGQFMGDTQPAAFLLIDCIAFPKKLEAKDGKPGMTLTGYKWMTVPDDQQPNNDALNAKRVAAGLPKLG